MHNAAVMMAVCLLGQRPVQVPKKSPDGISYESTWNVAKRCWSKDAGQRISMEEAVELLALCTDPSARIALSSDITTAETHWEPRDDPRISTEVPNSKSILPLSD